VATRWRWVRFQNYEGSILEENDNLRGFSTRGECQTESGPTQNQGRFVLEGCILIGMVDFIANAPCTKNGGCSKKNTKVAYSRSEMLSSESELC
jgi:hypothetical protein